MKKFFAFILSVTFVLSFMGCAPANGGSTNSTEKTISTSSTATSQAPEEIKIRPCDVLDNATGIVYSFGMQKSIFDDAFGMYGVEVEENEIEGVKITSATYLNGCLMVAFYGDYGAYMFASETANSRFSFYQFEFQTPEHVLAATSQKRDYGDYTAYIRYLDEAGEHTKSEDARYFSLIQVARTGNDEGLVDGSCSGFMIGDITFISIS